jgi:2-polyprenyl-6-methoxyphenol hydroxylase-like FAD-dependent oxidoreductase
MKKQPVVANKFGEPGKHKVDEIRLQIQSVHIKQKIQMKIGIIGSGIGGLATAVCLERLMPGTPYTLLEQAPQITEVGAGIGLGDNGVQILVKLGLLSYLQKIGSPITKTQLRDKNNTLIKNLPIGKGGYCVHRAELLQMLLTHINKENIRLNKRCVRINEDTQVETICEDGSSYIFDVLIAADGIHSVAGKELMLSKQIRYSGQTCYRGISSKVLQGEYRSAYIEFIGNNLRFGLADMGAGKTYWYAAKEVGPDYQDKPEDRKDHLMELFSSFPSIVKGHISHSEQILRNDMYDLKPSTQKWYTEKVCLIGDAAHATTPNLAQGGCQALEDAYTLVSCLAKSKDIKQAFNRFQTLRQEKTDFVVNQSWRYGQMMHTESKLKEKLLLLMLRWTPEQYFASQLHTINNLQYLDGI